MADRDIINTLIDREDALLALRRIDAVRDFPQNTCAVSRHAQIIGTCLARRQPYPPLTEEPSRCAAAILYTVAALYQARTEITRLTNLLASFRAVPPSASEASPVPVPDAWLSDPDTIPTQLIDACRDAICREFGSNGTDGYYKRILAKVFAALAAAQSAPEGPQP